jgi:hypothetical protein
VLPLQCQCDRLAERCANDITQEDLLCDVCRGGGCALRYRGTHLGWQYHTHVAWPGDGDTEIVAAAMQDLDDRFGGEGSWVTDGSVRPLHLVDAGGRHFLNPDGPLIPHDHNGVPCKDVP